MDLDDVLLTKIFSFLPYVDKIKIERVCKRWRKLSKSTQTVELLGFAEIWEFILIKKGRGWKVNLDVLEKALMPCQNSVVNVGCINYEEASGVVVKTERKLFTTLKKLCPNLHTIVLMGIDLSPVQIRSLADNLGDQITKLSIDFRECSSDESFSYLFKKTRKLQSISLIDKTEFKFTGKCLLDLPTATLEEFHLVGNFNTEADVGDFCRNYLSLFIKLHTIKLHNCFRFEFIFVHYLSRCPQFARQLKYLCVTNPSVNIFQQITLLPFNPLAFENCTNLKTLVLDRDGILNDAFIVELIRHCRNLVNVTLYDSKKITDAGLQEVLTSLPNLQKLHLSDLCNITGKVFEGAVNLKHLILTECAEVEKNGLLRLLSKDSKLESLEIKSCKKIEANNFLKSAIEIFETRRSNQVVKLYLPKDKVKNTNKFLSHLQLFLF